MPMPIFHDDQEPTTPQPSRAYDHRFRHAQHSPRDRRDHVWSVDYLRALENAQFLGWDDDRSGGDYGQSTLDRAALIERLKRSQSPPVQHHHTVSIRTAPAQKQREDAAPVDSQSTAIREERSRQPSAHGEGNSQDEAQENAQDAQDASATGLSIERPRSALHSGDFRQERDAVTYHHQVSQNPALSTSPVAPWHHAFPNAALPRIRGGATSPQPEYPTSCLSRQPSQSSLPSSFVLLPPSSPLVQQTNNTDLDFSHRPSSRQGERDNRRHTFSPHSLQTYHTSHAYSQFPGRSHPSLRQEKSFPYQAHQPRRSLSSFFGPHSNSTPQSPQLRPRGPSMTNETSPLQHAPMVGSYEESILRGRMSTTPSRPLNFIAQIGVLGKGDCKANLRCPAHVTLPFPAVFYSYNSGNGRIADNQPSPYVGLVDLENNLKPAEEQEEKRRRRRHVRSDNQGENEDQDHLNGFHEGVGDAQQRTAHRKREKMKRRSTSPKSPPGGSYRIPQKGQLQIVIKNPNKTAVKLFLVPYDLSDMEPGQKTFIRQRSYSAGPIIDMPLSKRTNFGTDRPEASLSTSEDPNDRPTLRYLIHLHICCPSKGRYFLYKSIRVVFANRVPDGKEKLRNEIQLPEPRYSAYKPARESQGAPQSSRAPAASASEKALRRRSAGLSLSHGQARYDRFDELDFGSPSDSYVGCQTYAYPMEPIVPIPFKLSRRLEPVESRPGSRDQMDVDGSSRRTSHVGSLSSQGNQSSFDTDQTWEKRAAGSFSPPPSHAGAGLLAQRLKGLQTSTHETHTKDDSNGSA
ncbi:uncharacterized protein BKCO1_4000072 [Diplodia corticola]|uniref:Atos-like conserved domain-containing protein n=1 Tax=Diplodia corticola TaxID=236234 RepID=A0A1J9RXM9_9PEZI|nr:uncharacterized protein BKCO1_4000072 [Diplodia corticola]OJD32229.1 hypothetical protein BKCO1_4000072 [Diplodia corticola]